MTSYNFQGPPTAFAAEFEDMRQRFAEHCAERKEKALVAALTKHLGRIPTVEEARQHARCLVYPDGRREWCWGKTVIMEEPSYAELSGSLCSKNGVVVARY